VNLLKDGLSIPGSCDLEACHGYQYISVVVLVLANLIAVCPSISQADGSMFPRALVSAGAVHGISLTSIEGTIDNHRPLIESFQAIPNPAPNPHCKVTFTFKARDVDGDRLFYVVDFGDGSSLASMHSAHHVYDKAGSYSAILYVHDGRGSGVSQHIQVIINDAPPAKVTGFRIR